MANFLPGFPLWAPLTAVFAINVIVFGLTYVLVYKLRSGARIRTGKYTVHGALAGFIIITSLEIGLVDHFTPPASAASRPSGQAVGAFYKCLQSRQFSAAWQLLDPSLQKSRWQGNFDTFLQGYKHTISIDLLAIEPATENSSASQEYVAYYINEVDTPVIPGLEDLYSKSVKDLGSLVQAVDHTRDRLRAEGVDADAFDQISLADLVAPDRGTRIIWVLDSASNRSSKTKVEDLFPRSRKVRFIEGRRITTQSTKEGWRISSISELPEND